MPNLSASHISSQKFELFEQMNHRAAAFFNSPLERSHRPEAE